MSLIDAQDGERQGLLTPSNSQQDAPTQIYGSVSGSAVVSRRLDRPPERSAAELVFILAGVYCGAFMAALDSTLVGTLSGPISASFGNMKLLGWLASSYFIATCGSQPLVGKITDIYGRKSVLLVSNVLFCLGNLICAVAPKESVLILGRVVAGIGGGAMLPTSSFIMSDLIPLRRRGVWQGTMNVCWGVGSGIGGPFGGWITDALTWRWAFAVQVPITVVGVIFIALRLPETVEKRSGEDRRAKFKRIDWLGSVTIVSFLVLLLVGLNAGGNLLPWNHPIILAAFPLSAACFATFIWVECYFATEPVLPLALFKNRTVVGACLVNWFTSMARFGLLFYAPLIFQVQGYSATQTGLRFIPESVSTMVSSLGAGMIMRATGRYYLLALSSISVQILGQGLVSSITLYTASWQPFVFLATAGLGYSSIITTSLIALISAVDQTWQAVITSASYIFRSTGTVIGITVASAVFQNVLRSRLRVRLQGREGAERLIERILNDIRTIQELHEPLKKGVQEAYMSTLHVVFQVLVGFAAVGLLCGTLMKQHKLHTKLSRRDS